MRLSHAILLVGSLILIVEIVLIQIDFEQSGNEVQLGKGTLSPNEQTGYSFISKGDTTIFASIQVIPDDSSLYVFVQNEDGNIIFDMEVDNSVTTYFENSDKGGNYEVTIINVDDEPVYFEISMGDYVEAPDHLRTFDSITFLIVFIAIILFIAGGVAHKIEKAERDRQEAEEARQAAEQAQNW